MKFSVLLFSLYPGLMISASFNIEKESGIQIWHVRNKIVSRRIIHNKRNLYNVEKLDKLRLHAHIQKLDFYIK